MIMNFETQPVIFEDIGQQVLATGEWKRPDIFMEKIHTIKAEDIQRIAKRMLCSKPAVVALGDLRLMPEEESIVSALSSCDGKLPTPNLMV